MKHILSAVLFGLTACAFAADVGSSTPKGFTDDFDAALADAAKTDRKVLAVFSGSDWCIWCKRLESEVFAKDAFLEEATNKFVLVFVDSPNDKSLLSDTGREHNEALTAKYGIRGFPTVLVLDAKGTQLASTGYQRGGPEKYLKHLAEIVETAPLRAKYIDSFQKELEGLSENFGKKLSAYEKNNRGKPSSETEKETAGMYRTFIADLRAALERFEKTDAPAAIAGEKKKLIEQVRGAVDALEKAYPDAPAK